eukprot:scaffold85418_cov63-Phaeocystis_antarctica.AAC.2
MGMDSRLRCSFFIASSRRLAIECSTSRPLLALQSSSVLSSESSAPWSVRKKESSSSSCSRSSSASCSTTKLTGTLGWYERRMMRSPSSRSRSAHVSMTWTWWPGASR